MITHLSTRADGACKKFKDLNEQVGEHVDAVAQLYAPIFIFQCLLYVSNCLQLSIVCLSIVFVCYNLDNHRASFHFIHNFSVTCHLVQSFIIFCLHFAFVFPHFHHCCELVAPVHNIYMIKTLAGIAILLSDN